MDFELTEEEELIGITGVEVLEVDAESEILEDAIVESASSPVVPAHGVRLGVADGREVGNLRIRVGQETERDVLEFEVIAFEVPSKAGGRLALVHQGEEVLHVANPALVELEVFLRGEGHRHVFQARGAAHDLEAVVEGGDDFDVLQGRAGADTIEAESIGLVPVDDVLEVDRRIRHLAASVPDGHVAQDTARLGVVKKVVVPVPIGIHGAIDIAALAGRIHDALGEVVPVIGVELAMAIDHDASPQALGVVGRGPVHGIALVREDNGTICGAVRHNLATTGHDETAGRLSLTGLGLDDRTGIDGQNVPGIHVNEAVQHVQRVASERAGARSSPPIIGQVHHGTVGHGRASTVLRMSTLNEEKAEGKQQAHMNRLLHGEWHQTDKKVPEDTFFRRIVNVTKRTFDLFLRNRHGRVASFWPPEPGGARPAFYLCAMVSITTILLTIGLLALGFAGIAIKILVQKDGEFAGTCSSNNPLLDNEDGSCSICGASRGDRCQKEELPEGA